MPIRNNIDTPGRGRPILITTIMKRILILFPSLLFLHSCASHMTSAFDGKVIQSGDIYSLPRTSFKVSIKKTDATLSYAVVPTMEPDREFRFSLKSSANPFFDVKHKTTIANGLLTTVNSEDKGQLDEFLKASVGAFMMPGMLSSTSVGGVGRNQMSSQDLKLALEEYTELLKRVPNGDYSFDLVPGNNFNDMALPGTDGVLVVTVTKSKGSKRVPRSQVDQQVFKPKQCLSHDVVTPADGVLARSVIPVNLTVSLQTNGKALKAWRTARADYFKYNPNPDMAAYGSARKSANDLKTELDAELVLARSRRITTDKLVVELNNKLNAAAEADKAAIQKELTAATAAQDAAFKRCSDLASEIAKTVGDISSKDLQLNTLDAPKVLVGRQMDAYYKNPNSIHSQILFQQSFSQMQADESYVILIPMDRSLMGTTKNQLSFSSGILTDHTREVESQALAFIKIPTTIAKEIVSVPAVLFTSAAATNKARQDLIDSQTNIIASQIKLLEAIDRAKPHTTP